jgi:hypothetical protein
MSAEAWNEERLGELLRLFKPAPTGWVEAAAQLPQLRTVFDDLVERAEADAAFREVLIADLEAALQREGVEPTRAAVHALELQLRLK